MKASLTHTGWVVVEDATYVDALRKQACANDANAMLKLADCYLFGHHGKTIDNAQGVELLRRAASDAQVPEAMTRLAEYCRCGRYGLRRDLAQATHWYQLAQNGHGLYDVGCDYYRGDTDAVGATSSIGGGGCGSASGVGGGCGSGSGVGGGGGDNRDVERAVALWKKACDLGVDMAMTRLGWCYQHGVGVECDWGRAVELYHSATRRGNCHWWRLAVCYLRGEGVERDWAKAFQLLQRKPERYEEAYLGWCYLWGCGAEKDVSRAVGIFKGAQLNSAATVFLGYCHERGIGVERDSVKARELFNKAKKMTGGAEELGELGDFCQTGCCGVTIDLEAAAEYFRMGSEGGDPVSMFHLGVCLRDDGYVEQAQFWLRKSAQLEHRQAAKLLLLQKNPCETPVDHSHPQANRSISAGNGSQAVRDIEALQQQNEDLKEKVAKLERDKEELKEALCQERNSVENLWTDITRYKTIVSTMTALISATSADFTVDRLLGTGSNAAVFKVQFHTSNLSASSITSTTQSAYSYSRMGEPENRTRTRDMVMKALFNWETTPQHTMLRQKYMAECVILSLVPGHPNVIHPLGALVLPCLPLDFVDKIPIEKPFYRELSRYKTLVVLMPYAGIPLPSFFSSLVTTSPSATTVIEISKSLFVQGLKAIHHIESCAVVHRDIKADNILIDPESHKLTLIDFGEAQHCPNMELSVSATMNAWGNTGTIPPELSIFLQGRTRGATGVFSYSKCDSFALALTFWDVFLPPTNKFIGSLLNQNMSSFTTPALLNKFPVMLFSSAAILPINNNLRVGDMLLSKMIEMMHPKKDARLSAYDALSQLLNL